MVIHPIMCSEGWFVDVIVTNVPNVVTTQSNSWAYFSAHNLEGL